ncbi:uncharacterized protein LOC135697316 [Ochlerotatus camptorhynchus]|uniref:uncharacterized protein LOC135697316 n=1 Tax=Ochlerotatus camptorhynchus TaxID=644619 RepID=UPI0031D04E11
MELSVHQSLSPELRIMTFQLWVMQWTGLVGPQGHFYRFALAFGWGSFVKLVPKIVLGMGSSQFDVIVKGLSELLYQGNVYIAAALLVLHLSSFNRMINLTSEIIKKGKRPNTSTCYDLVCVQNSKLNKFAKFYLIYCFCGSLLYCVPAMATSYLRYFGSRNNITDDGSESEPVQFELSMEQEFYGLQIRTDFTHYNIFMACSLLAYFVGGYMSTIKVTAVVSAMRCSSLAYRLVAMQVRKLNDSRGVQQKKRKITTADIEEIIDLHCTAFEITDLLENMLSIQLAMQFLSCLLFWCLVMFYVSMHVNFNLVNVTIPFCLSLIETYAYSYLGSELTAEAEEVGQAIYELPWYEDSAELQRYYCLIIQRSQRATGTTAVKFFLVGIDKFGGLLQMSYSYYLVLKDVFNTL